MVPMMDVAAYLDRIGYHGPVGVNLETLLGMHQSHFFNVPFENLDIARGVPIEVDGDVNFRKIVGNGRGGFCLELTGLFARALRQIGFQVDVLGARVIDDGLLGHPLEHMALLVHLDEPWLADVGFGGRIPVPVRLRSREPVVAGTRRLRVDHDEDHWLLTASEPGSGSSSYLFTLRPREWEEFGEVCRWLQTSPESSFTQGDVVSLATPAGRKTYSRGRFIETEGEARSERVVAAAEFNRLLRDELGLRHRTELRFVSY